MVTSCWHDCPVNALDLQNCQNLLWQSIDLLFWTSKTKKKGNRSIRLIHIYRRQILLIIIFLFHKLKLEFKIYLKILKNQINLFFFQFYLPCTECDGVILVNLESNLGKRRKKLEIGRGRQLLDLLFFFSLFCQRDEYQMAWGKLGGRFRHVRDLRTCWGALWQGEIGDTPAAAGQPTKIFSSLISKFRPCGRHD